MENREMICINCPMGCIMNLEIDNKEVISIKGNSCKYGEKYAREEVKNPLRVVCSTVRVLDGIHPVVSVKTENPIPKDKIFNVMKEINLKVVKSPVNIGDIIIENVSNTNVNIIATSSISSK